MPTVNIYSLKKIKTYRVLLQV